DGGSSVCRISLAACLFVACAVSMPAWGQEPATAQAVAAAADPGASLANLAEWLLAVRLNGQDRDGTVLALTHEDGDAWLGGDDLDSLGLRRPDVAPLSFSGQDHY